MLSCLICLCVFIVVNMNDVGTATTKSVISMTSRFIKCNKFYYSFIMSSAFVLGQNFTRIQVEQESRPEWLQKAYRPWRILSMVYPALVRRGVPLPLFSGLGYSCPGDTITLEPDRGTSPPPPTAVRGGGYGGYPCPVPGARVGIPAYWPDWGPPSPRMDQEPETVKILPSPSLQPVMIRHKCNQQKWTLLAPVRWSHEGIVKHCKGFLCIRS